MSEHQEKCVADFEGPWTQADFASGLIERCKRGWYTPVDQLSNELLATYLRQKIALSLMLPEARRRLEKNYTDGTESHDEELSQALASAEA